MSDVPNSVWQALIERYPQWATPEARITLTARGLERMVQIAYDQGIEDTERNMREQQAPAPSPPPQDDDLPKWPYQKLFDDLLSNSDSIFDHLFGKPFNKK